MFEDVKKDDRQVVSGPGPTEDMFADVDPTKDVQSPPKPSAISQGALKPVGGMSGGSIGPAQPLQSLQDVMPEGSVMVKPSIVKRLLIWLLSVAVIVVVGWGGYWVYAHVIAPAMSRPAPSSNTNTPDTNSNAQPVNNQATPTNNNVIPTSTSPATIDTDGDGLTDIEEQLLGTDSTNADTDRDGLTDYEEVKIYGTDPLNPDSDNDGLTDREEVITWKTNPKSPDTDGDGFQDGMEIKNGYNPLGAGKLTPDQLSVTPTQQ